METGYPKLKYPLNRRALSEEAGLILLAYDMIFRLMQDGNFDHLSNESKNNLTNDAMANLCGLGAYIKEAIGNDRFEGSEHHLDKT